MLWSSSLRNPFFKHLTSSLSLLRPLILSHPPLFSHFSSIPQINPIVIENRTFARLLSRSGISTSSSNISSSDNWTSDVSTSPYLSIRLHCPKDVADMLSEALLCFGASSTSMDEPENCEGTDQICIHSVFTECDNVDTCISHAADSIGLKELPSYEVITDEQCEWIKKSQESFHPVEVTEGLWIVPEWITPPDLQATNISLNPGLAFGTGDHPTTKLCLLLLHDLIKGGESFLDYGTGSGILGIAAVKLGAALSVGLDIDPEAITRARQNAALNHIGPEKMQLRLIPSDAMPPQTDGREHAGAEHQKANDERVIVETENYDIVIANIHLNPLIELVDDIVAYAKPGAVVAVTGIILEQLPRIQECYSPYLESISVSKMDGWACVSGRKKRNPRCN